MGRGIGRMGETPGGRGARLYEDAAGAGKDAPARDGGPGFSWARASGGDFSTGSHN